MKKKFFRSTRLRGHPLRCSNSKCPISHFFAPSVTHFLFRNGMLLVPQFQNGATLVYWKPGMVGTSNIQVLHQFGIVRISVPFLKRKQACQGVKTDFQEVKMYIGCAEGQVPVGGQLTLPVPLCPYLVPTLPGFKYTSVAPSWNRGT